MALTEEEIKSIGRQTGKKVVVNARCKERAEFVLETSRLMERYRNSIIDDMTLNVPKTARDAMAQRIQGNIEMANRYPNGPIKVVMEESLSKLKALVERVTKEEEPSQFIGPISTEYLSAESKLLDLMLKDFKECECNGADPQLEYLARISYGRDYNSLSDDQKEFVARKLEDGPRDLSY
jgi:hypothetical protein